VRLNNVGSWCRTHSRSLSVLKEIEAAVKKRLPSSDPEPHRKRDRLSTWVRNKTTDARRRFQDPDQLAELRRNLQNVVDGFTVCVSFAHFIGDS
jgi:hypothetical protein